MASPPLCDIIQAAHQPNVPTVMIMWSQLCIKVKSSSAEVKLEMKTFSFFKCLSHQLLPFEATMNRNLLILLLHPVHGKINIFLWCYFVAQIYIHFQQEIFSSDVKTNKCWIMVGQPFLCLLPYRLFETLDLFQHRRINIWISFWIFLHWHLQNI